MRKALPGLIPLLATACLTLPGPFNGRRKSAG
jgi:hypothetical protein